MKRMPVLLDCALGLGLGLGSAAAGAQGLNVPVPTACTPAVNAKLQQMVQEQPRGYVENVMVCGVAQKTTVLHGGAHGSHHLITVAVTLPVEGARLVQIAINDALDGAVSARAGQSVFAFGEGYVTGGAWVAGVHDVHCSTHRGADNGWVVVAGVKTPKACPARRAR